MSVYKCHAFIFLDQPPPWRSQTITNKCLLKGNPMQQNIMPNDSSAKFYPSFFQSINAVRPPIHLLNDYCPPSLRGIWTTNNLREINHKLRNANQYAIPYPRIELFKKSLLYSLPTQWNILNETKYHANPTTFKQSVKDQLIDDLS